MAVPLDRLDDIEVRQAPVRRRGRPAGTLTRSACPDGASTAALDTVVATLQNARYTAPGADLPDVTADSELVARTAITSSIDGIQFCAMAFGDPTGMG